jgi:hypothetical protein
MDTPRTDAEWNGFEAQDFMKSVFVVHVDFARQLERENRELLEALKAICDPHFWTNTVGEETFLGFEASEHLIRNGRAVIAKAEGK